MSEKTVEDLDFNDVYAVYKLHTIHRRIDPGKKEELLGYFLFCEYLHNLKEFVDYVCGKSGNDFIVNWYRERFYEIRKGNWVVEIYPSVIDYLKGRNIFEKIKYIRKKDKIIGGAKFHALRLIEETGLDRYFNNCFEIIDVKAKNNSSNEKT